MMIKIKDINSNKLKKWLKNWIYSEFTVIKDESKNDKELKLKIKKSKIMKTYIKEGRKINQINQNYIKYLWKNKTKKLPFLSSKLKGKTIMVITKDFKAWDQNAFIYKIEVKKNFFYDEKKMYLLKNKYRYRILC